MTRDRSRTLLSLILTSIHRRRSPLVNMSSKSPKRQRRHKAKDESETSPCYLHIIPVEVLAEILTLCSSPKDLLATARCSKHLCSTLIDVRNSFIWRRVRETMYPEPLPDPLPMFPEPAYAAFVFDGGRCSVRIIQY